MMIPRLGMPQFGSEPKFEPELCRTGPKFGSRFGIFVEPNLRSGSRFGEILHLPNLVEPGSNRTFRKTTSIFPKLYCIFYILLYYKISISSNKLLLQNIGSAGIKTLGGLQYPWELRGLIN